VIITSAYDEYALKGYELDVADYLLKPFTFDRFLKSIDKIYNQLVEQQNNNTNDYIFVKTEYRISGNLTFSPSLIFETVPFTFSFRVGTPFSNRWVLWPLLTSCRNQLVVDIA